MKTVKQVSDLAGVSIRTLHYYDEIGLLKPTEITEVGYRLYDDEALKTLQQILFFKELGISLKEVKEIMLSPSFNKIKALESQRKLLVLKMKRLGGLIDLIDKTLKGESEMSFKEFDMSDYFNMLENLKSEDEEKVVRIYGSLEKYDEFIEACKSNEDELSKNAIKQYGSIEKYSKAVKKNLNSDAIKLAEKFDAFKNDCLIDEGSSLVNLHRDITCNLNREPSSKEIQRIAKKIEILAKEKYELFNGERGEDNWYYMVQNYFVDKTWIKRFEEIYGEKSAKFTGDALKISLGDRKPRINKLIKELTCDLSKDISSKEIQAITKEIVEEGNKNNKILKIEVGENYWVYMADMYLSNNIFRKSIDKTYGEGASKFIGEALKFYTYNKK